MGVARALTFSLDGRFLASGVRDSTVRLLDAHTYTEKLLLLGRIGYVLAVAFSPDGKTLGNTQQRILGGGW
jgi:WD40 repeat protein